MFHQSFSQCSFNEDHAQDFARTSSVGEFFLPVLMTGIAASTNGNDIALHFISGKEQFGIFGCQALAV